MDVGLVATNDVHFLNKEDYEAHDALCCINTGKKVTEPERMKYPTERVSEKPGGNAGAVRRCAGCLRQHP